MHYFLFIPIHWLTHFLHFQEKSCFFTRTFFRGGSGSEGLSGHLAPRPCRGSRLAGPHIPKHNAGIVAMRQLEQTGWARAFLERTTLGLSRRGNWNKLVGFAPFWSLQRLGISRHSVGGTHFEKACGGLHDTIGTNRAFLRLFRAHNETGSGSQTFVWFLDHQKGFPNTNQ